MSPRRIVLAITGASGAVYGERALELLSQMDDLEVHLTISHAATITLLRERGRQINLDRFRVCDLIGRDAENVVYHHYRNLAAPIASGTFRTIGMMIVPCSMSTAGALAHGIAQNLIHRAAEVCLKERRRLVLVPRETPLSTIHLENLWRLSQAGAIILPAAPGFYHQPRTLEDQVDFIMTKLFDQFEIEIGRIRRWQG
ncbi:MAG: flavin prenyltransferase UbiX [Candidatus Poribacteria bacterium]|nr:MAG: flavin prenyltransferase UbiX [Candidatus Poribacteria bacterium]